jgi:subtilisin family serine protease
MRRRGAPTAIVVLLGLQALLAVRPAEAVHPRVMTRAVVVLHGSADLTRAVAGTRSRAAAVRAVVGALRRTATTSQALIVRSLRELESRGLARVRTRLWIVDAIVIEATPQVLTDLEARADVEAVVPDASLPIEPAGLPTEPNVSLIRAPQMWDLGFQGEGIVVASLDTGVSLTHPDLVDRWVPGGWFDPYGEHPDEPFDPSGHGTWTMGSAVGGGSSGSVLGVAPGARWMAARVFDDHGNATASAIHEAFQWILDPDRDPLTVDTPDVMMAPWASSIPGCSTEFRPDLKVLRLAGVLPIFPAGNAGPGSSTSRSPGNDPKAFAVGSTDDLDVLAPDSSQGPSACAKDLRFPDIAAPGVDVRTTDLFGTYADRSGTSMSTGTVAGALALLLQADGTLGTAQQAKALVKGATDLAPVGVDTQTGAGRLDVFASHEWLQGVSS